jgi:hypothetical protein
MFPFDSDGHTFDPSVPVALFMFLTGMERTQQDRDERRRAAAEYAEATKAYSDAHQRLIGVASEAARKGILRLLSAARIRCDVARRKLIALRVHRKT